jgi:hypothetical protein
VHGFIFIYLRKLSTQNYPFLPVLSLCLYAKDILPLSCGRLTITSIVKRNFK